MNLRGHSAYWPPDQTIRGHSAYWPSDQTIGDAGTDNNNYSGDFDPSNPLSLDFYRQKISDFQVSLNAVDAMYTSLKNFFVGDLTDEQYQIMVDLANEIDSQRNELHIVVSMVQGLSTAANAMGIRLPYPSSGLGVAPVVIAGTAAVLIAIAGFISWQVGITARFNSALQSIADDPDASPESKQKATLALNQQSAISMGANIGSTIKWAIIGLAGFFAYQIYMKKR